MSDIDPTLQIEQLEADKKSLFNEIDNLKRAAEKFRSAAGVQERHHRKYREKVQAQKKRAEEAQDIILQAMTEEDAEKRKALLTQAHALLKPVPAA